MQFKKRIEAIDKRYLKELTKIVYKTSPLISQIGIKLKIQKVKLIKKGSIIMVSH